MNKNTFLTILLLFSSGFYCNSQTTVIKPNGTAASVKGMAVYETPKHNKPGNGSNVLANSYYKSAVGLNYVSASRLTETRSGAGHFNQAYGLPDTLVVSGLPASVIIDTVFVYFTASYTEISPPACTISITNPAMVANTYTCVTIGSAGPVCWSEVGTASYKTGVNPAIAGNGVYYVNISGFTNPNGEVDGVTLFIVYTDPLSTTQGTIVIADGCESFMTTNLDDTLTGFTTCPTGTSGALAFVLAGDIQANLNGGFVNFTMNGTTATFVRDFWDIYTLNTVLGASQTSAAFMDDDGSVNDCYVVTMQGLYFQPCDNNLAVHQLNINGSLEVYPNPAKNSININFPNPIDGTIRITNVLGQQVYSEKIATINNAEQIDISPYSNGVYFLTIEWQGQRLVKKVVKM